MADGDEFIITAKLFEQNQLSRARALFELYSSSGAIILHFRHDFETPSQKKKIVLNSWSVWGWGNELHHASPFKPGQHVKIHVKKLGDIYEITLTDGVVLTFPHRFSDTQNPTSFYYLGDWTFSKIQMICAKRNSESE
ncbi:unnamed protein product [Caenorhabditis bovis]|uniref:Galectin n=1 Tax=Caenorhabditis bovis TaxID=2654633 RepID=A0A8S1EHJ5_9PELO|nr:unnamed protein product [Caenorhabditis bovis]